jgi:hypothetical protein
VARRVRRVVRSKGGSRVKASREIAEKQAVSATDRAVSDVDAADGEADAISAARGRGRGVAALDDVEGLDIEAGREAYESVLKTNVASDFARFESMRKQGAKDVFDPTKAPLLVEKGGPLAAATHLIRLYDAWILDGLDRYQVIDKAASWLSGFERIDSVKKVLLELESKPIRDIYPLEVMIALVENSPQTLPGIAMGPVLTNAESLTDDEHIFAGHAAQLHLPSDVRVKHFAPLDGVRMGYEFFPSHEDGKYTLLVDTPGVFEFALFAAQTEQLGRMTREQPGGLIDVFEVTVREMGKKEPSVSV